MIQSTSLFATSLCKHTRVNIKNLSSFDCVLTDFVGKGKMPESVMYKNQSITFDIPDSSSGKNLIVRYQCGDDASALLYFYSHYESIGTGYRLSDRLKTKSKNLKIESSRTAGQCNLFTEGKPSQWFIEMHDQLH